MRHLFPMLLLCAGTALAAAFGSINGPQHQNYRTASWAVQEAGAGVGRIDKLAKMDASLLELAEYDAAGTAGALSEEQSKALYKTMRPFELAYDDDAVLGALTTEAEAAKTTLAEQHGGRTEQLVETGFLSETTAAERNVQARTVAPGIFEEVVGADRWQAVITKADNFALGTRKMELVGPDGAEVTEEDAAIIVLIDAALLPGADKRAAKSALAARGLALPAVDTQLVKSELLSGEGAEATMTALVEAGQITLVQSYSDRLAIAADEVRAPDAEAGDAGGTAKIPQPQERITQWGATGGAPWGLGVVLITVGAIMARRAIAEDNAGTSAGDGDGASADRVDFQAMLDEVLSRLDKLITDAAGLEMDDDAPILRAEIDAIFLDLLQPAVDQRGRFVARHGLSVFAGYFSPFAAGERNLARSWSALTDGHAVVGREALGRARDSFQMADDAWKKAEAGLA